MDNVKPARMGEHTGLHGSTHFIWFVCSDGEVGVLRARESQPPVYPIVPGLISTRGSLRVSAWTYGLVEAVWSIVEVPR